MNSRVLFNLAYELHTATPLSRESREYCREIFPETSLFFLLKGDIFYYPFDFIPVTSNAVWETLHNDPAGIFCRRIEPEKDEDQSDLILCVSLLGKDITGENIAAGIIYSEGWGKRSGQEEHFYNVIADLKRFYADFSASRAVNLFLNDKSLVHFVVDPQDCSIIARNGLESDESGSANSIWNNIISKDFLTAVLSRDSAEGEHTLTDGPIRNFNMARFKLNRYDYAILAFRCPVLRENFPDYDLVIRNFAHRMRNKLAALQSASSQLNLRKGKAIDDKEIALAQIIEKACDSTVRMVDRLHQFSRLSRSQNNPVDLGKSIARVVDKKKRENQGDIAIQYKIDNQAGTIMGDSEQIETAITELLDNAVATNDKIDITLRNADNRTTLTFHNRTESEFSAVEDRNKNLNLAPFVSTRPDRTGMGLTLVRRIVANHGGNTAINYDQESGFSVTLDFPTATRR
jgi:signal transduction histidine kinase